MREWGQGSVSLLGDAAHAMAPNLAQGACNAIEDALCLAAELRTASLSVAAQSPSSPVLYRDALRAYERARKPRAHFIQRMSRLVGVVGALGGPLAAVRDAALRHTPQPIKTFLFNQLHRLLLGWNYTAPNTGQSLYPRLLGAAAWKQVAEASPEGLARFHTAPPNSQVIATGRAAVARQVCACHMCDRSTPHLLRFVL